MAVVVDANVLVALESGDPRKPAVQQVIRGWVAQAEEIHAPMLLPYEAASGLTRIIASGGLSEDQVAGTWRIISQIPITYHPLELGSSAVEIALRLRRHSAYDAAYLLLVQQNNSTPNSGRSTVYDNATHRGLGFPCIRLKRSFTNALNDVEMTSRAKQCSPGMSS